MTRDSAVSTSFAHLDPSQDHSPRLEMRASRGAASSRLIGWLAIMLAGAIGCLLFLRLGPTPGPVAIETQSTPVRDAQAPSTERMPVAVDEPERSEGIEDRAHDPSPERTSSLHILMESARGDPWNGPFDLWLAHVPRIGHRSLLPGEYRALTGPRSEIGGLAPGRYTGWARASARRSSSFSVEIAVGTPSAELELTLVPAGAIEGRCVGDEGSALDGIRLTLERDQAEVDSTRTDELGRFRFESVLDGDYELIAGPKLSPLMARVPIHHVGTETDLGPIVISGLARLVVVVTGPSRRPVVGARVSDGDLFGHFDLRTDDAGSCVARHLPAGQLRVFVEDAVHGRANRPVKIEAGREARLEITMPQ